MAKGVFPPPVEGVSNDRALSPFVRPELEFPLVAEIPTPKLTMVAPLATAYPTIETSQSPAVSAIFAASPYCVDVGKLTAVAKAITDSPWYPAAAELFVVVPRACNPLVASAVHCAAPPTIPVSVVPAPPIPVVAKPRCGTNAGAVALDAPAEIDGLVVKAVLKTSPVVPLPQVTVIGASG